MNKKGNFFLITVFFILLFLIMFIGFMMAIGGAILNWVGDEALPEFKGLGQAGGANLTEIGDITINPLDTLVQSTTWITGVLYVLMILGSIGFAVGTRMNPQRWLIGLYFAFTLLLILTSIFISNMYEEIYTGTDDLAIRLQEQTLLSFFLLHSPLIFTGIVFLTGIVLFSGLQQEEFV